MKKLQIKQDIDTMHHFELESDNDDNFYIEIDQLIEYLKKVKEQYKAEFLEISGEGYWEGTAIENMELIPFFYRTETDDEAIKRIKRKEMISKVQRKKDLAELKRLKNLYPDV